MFSLLWMHETLFLNHILITHETWHIYWHRQKKWAISFSIMAEFFADFIKYLRHKFFFYFTRMYMFSIDNSYKPTFNFIFQCIFSSKSLKSIEHWRFQYVSKSTRAPNLKKLPLLLKVDHLLNKCCFNRNGKIFCDFIYMT